jgi:regulator of protease activity HflC (stomatin/prohibitin superfamily)
LNSAGIRPTDHREHPEKEKWEMTKERVQHGGREREVRTAAGWIMLVADLAMLVLSVLLFVNGVRNEDGFLIFVAVTMFVLAIVLAAGFFVVNPNEAAVLLLFGNYRGSVKDNGFWWTNPFTRRVRISLRARNFNSEKLKVNDRNGNPIEIAAVVVWQVENTAQASFDVDDYVDYVEKQSESAVRKLASEYPYDAGEDEVSLRRGMDEVNHRLQEELQERLGRAGVVVSEARLSHLAYAPEIASDMLRRQQASAVVAARQTIVEGAVGMVEMALAELAKLNVVELDEERKAAMVSNLLVVLCSESAAQPVINTGTLYH